MMNKCLDSAIYGGYSGFSPFLTIFYHKTQTRAYLI